tara:strand:- start:2697 stop:2957 length:261 start_codon:yes stop_codon:yes gene_type:complete
VSKFKVEGMMCVSGCAWQVNTIVQSIDGVSGSEVDFDRGILTVEYDSVKVSKNLIISKLSKETTYKVKSLNLKSEKSFLHWFRKAF